LQQQSYFEAHASSLPIIFQAGEHLQLEEMYVCISYLGWETDSTSRATYQNKIHEALANISKLGVPALW
jgi:hypothetical protein